MKSRGKLWAWQYHWPRRLVLLVVIPFLLVLTGTLGYYFIENHYAVDEPWTLLDALYMTVITLSTIGYGKVHPLSDAGKLFTILLILGGVFTFVYTATEIIRGRQRQGGGNARQTAAGTSPNGNQPAHHRVRLWPHGQAGVRGIFARQGAVRASGQG